MNTENNKLSKREEGLREAGRIYGKETEIALREHLDKIGCDFYMWMSNLYIPRDCKCDNFDDEGNRICLLPRDEEGKCLCSGGGFYISNSARDNEQFGIDIESTAQALFFLNSAGFIDDYDGDYKKAFPKQMQKDMIAFAKSLQDPEDGYFYHPQWGKNITLSRKGRDLGWSTSILQNLGDMPLWDTKNGHKGSLGAPTGDVSDNEEEKNSTWSEHLRTLDAFKEYLGSFELKTKSYSNGNMMNAQAGQFKGRDRKSIEDGEFTELNEYGYAKGGFVETLINFINENQNPENGLWEDEVHYNAVNGLMKIGSTMNSLGARINYPEKGFDSAMEVLLLDNDTPDVKGKLAKGSVDTFNPWVCMATILSNVKKFGTEEEYNRIFDKFKAALPSLIRASTSKMMKFRKPDGSFGYNWGGGGGFSQSAPVSIPGEIEGDINGGCIAVNGIFRNIAAALGIRIPVFTPDDFVPFIENIKKNCNYK